MEKTEYLILCDNAQKKVNQNQTVIELELDKTPFKKKGKGKDKIHLDTNNIKRLLTDNLSPVMLDLLEIATFVYVTGQLTTRGGLKEFEYGSKWYRHFDMVIPVRELDIWNYHKSSLEEILEFVSESGIYSLLRRKHMKALLGSDYKEGLEPEKITRTWFCFPADLILFRCNGRNFLA